MFAVALFIFQYFSLNSATDTPILGILSQERDKTIYTGAGRYESYIAASYVKYVEGAGARAIPVMIGQSDAYYERIVKYTNGILFPGGGAEFEANGGYGEAARKIFKYVVDMNERGIYYPLWGTCLGMEVLLYAELGFDVRVNCSVDQVSLPLHFAKGYATSRLFSQAPIQIVDILKNQHVTLNSHAYCLTREGVTKSSKWNVLATDLDNNNLEFVTALEHKKYPIYGVQFHPEKNIYEFKKNVGVLHTFDAVVSAQYFAYFIVNEARKNNNSYPSAELERRSLIYNYNPLYTGLNNSYFEQVYVFEQKHA